METMRKTVKECVVVKFLNNQKFLLMSLRLKLSQFFLKFLHSLISLSTLFFKSTEYNKNMLKYSDFSFGKVLDRSSKYTIMEANNLKTLDSLQAKLYRIPDCRHKDYGNILNEVIKKTKKR